MTLLLDVPDRIYESPSEQVKRRISELTKLPLEILKKNGKIFFDIYARVMKTLRGFSRLLREKDE